MALRPPIMRLALASYVALALNGCAGPGAPSASTSRSTSETNAQKYEAALQLRAQCTGDVSQRNQGAAAYWANSVRGGNQNGFVDKKQVSGLMSLLKEYDTCLQRFYGQEVIGGNQTYMEAARAYDAAAVQPRAELLMGRITLTQFRRGVAARDERFKVDYAAALQHQKALRQQQAAERAAEEVQQAEADAEEQRRTSARTAAMLGIIGSTMGTGYRPTYRAPQATPSYSPSRPAVTEFAPMRQTGAGGSRGSGVCDASGDREERIRRGVETGACGFARPGASQ